MKRRAFDCLFNEVFKINAYSKLYLKVLGHRLKNTRPKTLNNAAKLFPLIIISFLYMRINLVNQKLLNNRYYGISKDGMLPERYFPVLSKIHQVD